MLSKKELLPKSRIKLTIKAQAGQFRQAFEKCAELIGQKVKVEGFRPGKAPKAKVIEQVGRSYLETEALEEILQQTYHAALHEAQVVPTQVADIKIVEFKTPSEAAADEETILTFTAETDIYPQVKIDGYQKIRIKKKEEPEVKEDEVERVLEYLRKQRASVKEVGEEAVVKEGIWIEIGYEGSVDGVKRTDMINKNHPLVVGEGQLIPGFEEEIKGMKKGEVRTFAITFPKDYHAKELAGKKAEFTVRINEMRELVLPELDPEFAKAFGHDSMEELTQAIRANLKEEKEQESRQKVEEEVLDQLVKIAKIDLPGSMVEQELERMFAETKERLEKMQFNWETYLSQTGKTIDSLREEMRPQAEKRVRTGLALGQLIKEENLQPAGYDHAHEKPEHKHHEHQHEEEGVELIRAAVDRLLDIAAAK